MEGEGVQHKPQYWVASGVDEGCDNEDGGVDTVDLALFVGHGNEQFATFNYAKVEGYEIPRAEFHADLAEMRLGDTDLEWAGIMTCHFFQNPALDKIKQVFQGLHGLMSYVSRNYPTNGKGTAFAGSLQDGETYIKAWFQAEENEQLRKENPDWEDEAETIEYVAAQMAVFYLRSAAGDRLPGFWQRGDKVEMVPMSPDYTGPTKEKDVIHIAREFPKWGGAARDFVLIPERK